MRLEGVLSEGIGAHNKETDMNITVQIKSNYGNRAVYPACDTSRKLAALIGTKTFTDAAIEQIKALGYVFTVQPASL